MKSSREQFEEWFPQMVEGMPENMAKVFDKMLFTAWQASRAAIEIELPDITDAQYQSKHIEGGFRAEAFWLQVRKYIENVGLKVKS